MPLLDADRLADWGRSTDSENKVPELLLRLAWASSGRLLRTGEFRTGRGIQLGGYDGFTDSVGGDEFLPSGPAVWEIGTQENPERKAQDDYEKRTAKPGPVNPAATTYIAVTSRRWARRADWEADRNAERVWNEVRAYDCDSLYTFLLKARIVHLWLSEHLKTQPEGEVTAEEWWDVYRHSGTPALLPHNVTDNRDNEVGTLLQRLVEKPDLIRVHGKDRQEAIAFVVAAVLQAPEDSKLGLLACMSVVEHSTAWRNTVRGGTNLILVPEFESVDLFRWAVSRGHIVLAPATTEDERAPTSIFLRPLRAEDVATRLQAAGASPSAAARATSEAAESITDLRLAIDTVRNPDRPEWARPASARQLAPFVLAGLWDDARPADRTALEQLAGRSYRELTDLLVEWRLAPRPPVSKTGSVWSITNRREGWHWTYSALVEEDLKRFHAVCVEVLREADPKYDLDADQRWMAGAMGKNTAYSERLREGLADGLAMLGATAVDHPIDGPLTGEDLACITVRDVLANSDWKRWASLAPVLNLLAEACPDEFLSAIERDVRGDEPVLRAVFTDRDQAVFGVSSPHSNLLFALEMLGRSPAYLSRVAVNLSRLVQLDPGGVLANRPQNSLIGLFRAGFPQTAAPLDQRLTVLDTLRDRFPAIAWSTMVGALPIAGTFFTPSPAPRWRKWPLEGER